MADADDAKVLVARLNEIVDVLGSLRSDRISDLLKPKGDRNKCDYDCGCNQSMCDCRGSVCANKGSISFVEFEELRDSKIAELRQEIERLEPPKSRKG